MPLSPFTTDEGPASDVSNFSPGRAPSIPGAPRAAAPSLAPSPFAPPANPGENAQTRINGLNGDLAGAARQYGVQAYNQHWTDLTKSLDPNNNTDVENFAKQYGVQRGQIMNPGAVPGIPHSTGQYTTMTNDQLLQAAKQKYQPQFQQTNLLADPTYNSILNGTHPSVAGIAARRLGQSPFAVGAQQGEVNNIQNTAAAVPVLAGATADAGKGALYTGMGNQSAGEGKYKEGEAALTVAPSVAAVNTATANHTTAMQPYDTAAEDASTQQTKAYTAQVPQIVASGAAAADLTRRSKEAQIAKNNAEATRAAGGGDGLPPLPTAETPAAPAPAAPAAPAALTIGQKHAGSIITRVGTHPNVGRVYQLQDGRVVDQNGKVVK